MNPRAPPRPPRPYGHDRPPSQTRLFRSAATRSNWRGTRPRVVGASRCTVSHRHYPRNLSPPKDAPRAGSSIWTSLAIPVVVPFICPLALPVPIPTFSGCIFGLIADGFDELGVHGQRLALLREVRELLHQSLVVLALLRDSDPEESAVLSSRKRPSITFHKGQAVAGQLLTTCTLPTISGIPNRDRLKDRLRRSSCRGAF